MRNKISTFCFAFQLLIIKFSQIKYVVHKKIVIVIQFFWDSVQLNILIIFYLLFNQYIKKYCNLIK